MSGAGNDFVCLDNRKGDLKLTKKKIADLCHRQFGVGADGVLAIEPSPKKDADCRMRYYNADGGEAEMCGNGARCFARFYQKASGTKKEKISFNTKAGIIGAEFIKDQVRVTLTEPFDWNVERELELAAGTCAVPSVNTGVPHAVRFVDDLEDFDIRKYGAELRYHNGFAPAGTNANFAEIQGPKKIRVRTYERGVEDETLACGTGVTAVALLAHRLKGMKSPIAVKVQGGDTLKVYFDGAGESVSNVRLFGPADFVFKGEIDV